MNASLKILALAALTALPFSASAVGLITVGAKPNKALMAMNPKAPA